MYRCWQRCVPAAATVVGPAARLTAPPSSPLSSSSPLLIQQRGVFADKVRAGMVLRVDKRVYRVIANTRSQKGQNAASFNIKLTEVGTSRKKEVTAGQGHDFSEVRAERVRLLFSGFDDDDQACFVFPEHSSDAGTEVNLAGDSLPEVQQKFLSCGMPVDILHIIPDDDVPDEKEMWTEITMPSSYVYTVEKITLKGLYKMATFVECDGTVSVNDQIQLGEKIKVVIKPDGTVSFGGRANA
ncbi:Elongation factor P (EF-P) KOW-like domain containing protein [Novymonas esmeraldas]|uniref:Elongation factor P (EF-P) KOW-like domain containing protein n=1 Tax=Novymonas esmeraldas TaxID=1808958 RepID=A0AAW0ELN6_9TRYP